MSAPKTHPMDHKKPSDNSTRMLIFVPGYNVAKTIGLAITNLVKLHETMDFDVIYVDNCSADASVDIVKEIIAKNNLAYVQIQRNEKNLGYGGSQKVAFAYAFAHGYGFLMEYDGDVQYPYEAIPEIHKKIVDSGSSIVFGSRMTDTSHSAEMGIIKRFGNNFLNSINNWAFNFGVSEIHTGFRIYNLALIKNVNFSKSFNDYRWSMDSVVSIYKINRKFSEISIKGYYHADKSSPSFWNLVKYSVHIVRRALEYKVLGR